MAITKVEKQEFIAGTSTLGAKCSLVVPYIVTCNAIPGSIEELETASDGTNSVVALGDSIGPDSTRVCTKIDVKANGDKTTYTVTATLETVDPGWNQNPLLRKDTIRFEGSKESKSVFMTLDSTPKPIVTTAGEPFEKLPNQTTGAFKAIIEGFRTDANASLMASYLRPNAVNTGSVTVRGITFGDGELKMVAGNIELVTENGVTCWKYRWECECASDWIEHIDSRGYWQLVSGVLQKIVKGDPAQPVKKPWPLDSGGAALSSATGTPAIVDAKIQPTMDFSGWSWSDSF